MKSSEEEKDPRVKPVGDGFIRRGLSYSSCPDLIRASFSFSLFLL